MGHRPGEFSRTVRHEAMKYAEHKCERCGAKLGQKIRGKHGKVIELSVHHILPLHIAKSHFSHIPDAYLSSILNAEVLCQKCHSDDHEAELDIDDYRIIAAELQQSIEKSKRVRANV